MKWIFIALGVIVFIIAVVFVIIFLANKFLENMGEDLDD